MKYTAALILCLMLLPSFARGQDWVVPDDRKGRLSTFPFTDETRKEGERLYRINCQSCHGDPGKGNYIALVPSPGDPATEKIQRNSDGEIFYKLTVGRGQMPSFRSVLTTDEIWKVVSYLRSYNRSYVQRVMQVITSTAYPGAMISLRMTYDATERIVSVIASATSESGSVPVTGAGVRLLAERYFGKMEVDEEKTTDGKGMALFTVPEGLPGDTAGDLTFSAKFTDEESFGTALMDTVLRAGAVTVPVSLTAKRAMWNTVRKAPIWIILAYGLGVLAVWGFIILVMLKLRDIFTVGTVLREGLKGSDALTDTTKQPQI